MLLNMGGLTLWLSNLPVSTEAGGILPQEFLFCSEINSGAL